MTTATRETAEKIVSGFSVPFKTCKEIRGNDWLADAIDKALGDERERGREIENAAQQFVDAYAGKEHQLGNGQALRAFLRFRELLSPAIRNDSEGD